MAPFLAEADGVSSSKDDEAKPKTMDDDVRKAWAAALAASIPAEPLAHTAVSGDGVSTGAWRPTDVSMTELSDEVARAGGRPEARVARHQPPGRAHETRTARLPIVWRRKKATLREESVGKKRGELPEKPARWPCDSSEPRVSP